MVSYGGHPQIVQFLLQSGADKDLAGKDGTTTLMVTSQYGHLEVARCLLESGAKMNLTAQHRGNGSYGGGW